jgi:hypothetical protein
VSAMRLSSASYDSINIPELLSRPSWRSACEDYVGDPLSILLPEQPFLLYLRGHQEDVPKTAVPASRL